MGYRCDSGTCDLLIVIRFCQCSSPTKASSFSSHQRRFRSVRSMEYVTPNLSLRFQAIFWAQLSLYFWASKQVFYHNWVRNFELTLFCLFRAKIKSHRKSSTLYVWRFMWFWRFCFSYNLAVRHVLVLSLAMLCCLAHVTAGFVWGYCQRMLSFFSSP